MKHKKVAAALSAAVAGASVLAGIRYAVGKRKPKAEPETAIQEEGLTEGKLRECLLRLFRLYEDSGHGASCFCAPESYCVPSA